MAFSREEVSGLDSGACDSIIAFSVAIGSSTIHTIAFDIGRRRGCASVGSGLWPMFCREWLVIMVSNISRYLYGFGRSTPELLTWVGRIGTKPWKLGIASCTTIYVGQAANFLRLF